MSGHSKLVPHDYLGDPEIRAGYDEARRAIELGAMARQLWLDAGLSQEELAQRARMTQPSDSGLLTTKRSQAPRQAESTDSDRTHGAAARSPESRKFAPLSSDQGIARLGACS